MHVSKPIHSRNLFNTRTLQNLLPLHDTVPKPHQKHSPTGPHLSRLIMRRDLGLKTTPITNTLNNSSHESRTVEHTHLAWYADVRIDQRVIVRDHVLIRCVWGDGVLECICGAAKEEAPERAVD